MSPSNGTNLSESGAMIHHYDNITDFWQLPLSLAGLNSRPNIDIKFSYIEYHAKMLERDFEKERDSAQEKLEQIKQELHKLRAKSSETEGEKKLRLAQREPLKAQIPKLQEQIEDAKSNADQVRTIFLDLKREAGVTGDEAIETTFNYHLEDVLMPNAVRSLMR
jgi:predicted nuclease with TOPRIM domain